MRDLHEFLAEAELSEYLSPLLTRLKVSSVEHIKYVREEDLQGIGMTRPEMRRLKKFYKKECPHGALDKLKAILKGGSDGASKSLSQSTTVPRGPSPSASSALYKRPLGRQLIPADSIQLGRTLGEGEFGVVQQGIWKTELGEMLQVAVKRLSREKMNTGTHNFLKEAAIMQDVDNEHIVRMFGVVLDTENNMMLTKCRNNIHSDSQYRIWQKFLVTRHDIYADHRFKDTNVTELAPMRSLLECLRDTTLRVDLPVTRLCDYAIQVCDGMTYLESKRLVHRDLAARNILVFNKNLVKISDLGLSRLLGAGQDYYQSKFSVSLKLPIAWCAPECINFLKFTSASDIWSFAVMLWEFFTYGFQPWAGLSSLQILQAIDEPKLQRLEQPELCPPEIYKLMMECWTHDPETRPRFSDISLSLPQLRPVQVKAVKDCPSPLLEKGYIDYKAGDIIVVIDKCPVTSSIPGLIWKGVLANGKSGLFNPTNAVPFIEPKGNAVVTKNASIVRRDSGRKSGRKVRADMISLPQNDLRHMGHIGFDGVVFGDVAFIGDNYDKLPGKVDPGGGVSRSSSFASNKSESIYHNGHVDSRSSHGSLSKENNDQQGPWVSQNEGRYSPNYLDIEDDSVFSDFKMPELGTSFDFGPSFMDEVLRALDEKEKQTGSSTSGTQPGHQSHVLDSNSRMSSCKLEPPVPAPREIRTSLSSSTAPPLPAHPPRVEHPKEKKQAKVKPMSASDEKMVDNAIARARELTSHLIGSTYSPPISPSQDQKPSFFDDDAGIISRLRNSIKLSSSPKNGRKRTFSEELEQKGDLDVVTPEAQQAYNMLVVKGSFKEKSLPDFQHHMMPQDLSRKDMLNSRLSGSRSSSKSSQEFEPSDWPEPDMIRDSKSSSSFSKMAASTSSQLNAFVSPSQSPGKSVFTSQAKPVPSPAPILSPRPANTDNTVRPDLPTSRPHPEIHRVEPTIRHMGASPPDVAPRQEQVDRCIPGSGSRHCDQTKVTSRHCDQPKVTIEVVHIDDSEFILDDVFEKATTSFEHSSASSSQRSSGDTSDTAAYNNAGLESSESYNSRCSDQEIDATSSVQRKDSFSKKQTSSIFEEDLNAPSPQEIMNRLRERRLNRHLEHQRSTTDAETSSVTTRPRPSAREPQGIPGRVPFVDTDEGGINEEGKEEVDTNPLRMLRGGAVPVRTAGKSSAGTNSLGSRGAKALRVPQLNFSKHLSSSATDHQQTRASAGAQSAVHLKGEAVEVASHHPHSSSPNAITLDTIATDGSSFQTTPSSTASSLSTPSRTTSSQPTPSSTSSQPTLSSTASSQPASVSATSSQPASLSATSSAAGGCNSTELQRQPPNSSDVGLHHTALISWTVCADNTQKFPDGLLPPDHQADLASPPPVSTSCQSPPCTQPISPFMNTTAVPNSETSQTLNVENLAPPRLPPRRSQSLNEHSEKAAAYSAVLPGSLRRSSSTEESNESQAPALPPRQPHGNRTPLNARPRERKFPLQIHLSPQEKSPTGAHLSPSKHVNAASLTPKQISHLQSPTHAAPTSCISPTSSHSPHQFSSPPRNQGDLHTHRQPPHINSPTSPTRITNNRHSCLHNSPRSHPFEAPVHSYHLHHHHSSSIELPPPYDISVQQSVSLSDVADSEPTHMLLDPHTSHLPIPLSVSLPPSSDLTSIDEPTHVSLSSLSANKHSWSATFTSPSPLSPSFHHRQQQPVRSSQTHTTSAATRTLDRSFSSEAKVSSMYPNVSDNQSPPADLPPAPPTPSYREKLGLEHRRPKVVRSISHNSNTFKCGPNFLAVDSNTSFRGRSASTNSPSSQGHHHTDVCSTSPSHSSSSYRLAHYSHAINDDDTFFAEAPAYPHPYSQSPFHPLVSARDSSQTSLIYSSVSFPQSTPDISPYQISSAISAPNHSSRNLSQFEPAPPPPTTRRSTENHSVDSRTHPRPTLDSTPRVAIPRTTHTYNSVCLPPSHHAPHSSKSTSNNLVGKPTNFQACRQDAQTLPTSKHHLTTSTSTASQIFKFPNIVRKEGSFASSASSVATPANHGVSKNKPDLSPSLEYPSSSEVSPLMFASYNATSSVSYEDLRQFALDRQRNCEEIEILLKIFPDQVTVDECMTALEGTQWDVNKATKYLQLKKLLSLGMADVHRCKEALSSTGWDLQSAAETLLEASRTPGVSSSSSSSSSSRGSPARSGMLTSHHRPTSPEVLDV